MKNNYTIEDNVVKIELKRKSGEPEYTIIELADLPIVEAFPGTFRLKVDKKKGLNLRYAYAHVQKEDGGWTSTQLHRILLNPEKHQMVDHINRNGLDNRRSNLRVVNGIQNQYNRYIGKNNKSGVMGLTWHSGKQKWKAELKYNRQSIFEKYYDDSDKNQAIRELELVREAVTKVVMLQA